MSGLFFFIFVGVALASALPTFVFMWFRDGTWATRLACALGVATGMAISAHFHFDVDAVGHETAAAVSLVAAALSPLLVVHLLHDPEYPNEKWTPPGKRAKARAANSARDSGSDRAGGPWGHASDRPQNTGSDQAKASDRRQDNHRQGTGSDQAKTSDRRQSRRPPESSAQMPHDEAWQVLGLEPSASADEIHEAHHRLMMKLHPDVGGSNYLASKVNAARDALLGRHEAVRRL